MTGQTGQVARPLLVSESDEWWPARDETHLSVARGHLGASAAVPRALAAAPTLSVRAHGARGDGRTKDTAVHTGRDRRRRPRGRYRVLSTRRLCVRHAAASQPCHLAPRRRRDARGQRRRWRLRSIRGGRATRRSRIARRATTRSRCSRGEACGRSPSWGRAGSTAGGRRATGRSRSRSASAATSGSGGSASPMPGATTSAYSAATTSTSAGVTIENGYADGIDPDCCRNVRITDCRIESRDDAVVIKTSLALGRRRDTERVTVSGCHLVTLHNGLKLGTESSGDFRRSSFRDCTIVGGAVPVERRPELRHRPDTVDGGALEDVVVSASAGQRPFAHLRAARGRGRGQTVPAAGAWRDVRDLDVDATGANGRPPIIGAARQAVARIALPDIRMTALGGGRPISCWATSRGGWHVSGRGAAAASCRPTGSLPPRGRPAPSRCRSWRRARGPAASGAARRRARRDGARSACDGAPGRSARSGTVTNKVSRGVLAADARPALH